MVPPRLHAALTVVALSVAALGMVAAGVQLGQGHLVGDRQAADRAMSRPAARLVTPVRKLSAEEAMFELILSLAATPRSPEPASGPQPAPAPAPAGGESEMPAPAPAPAPAPDPAPLPVPDLPEPVPAPPPEVVDPLTALLASLFGLSDDAMSPVTEEPVEETTETALLEPLSSSLLP